MSFLSQPITLQSLFGADRMIDDIEVDVVINEVSNDTLTITKQPVQRGTPITDHAYKEPTVLQMKIRFNDNLTRSLSKIYQTLLDLQFPPVVINIVTPKRIYRSMLIATLGVTTDKYTENVIAIDITFQQVIIVNITPVQVVPLSQQATPEKTAAVQDTGESALFKSSKAVRGLIP